MKEPKYIVYAVKVPDYRFEDWISFNIIDWKTKEIYEIPMEGDYNSNKHLKKFTLQQINKVIKQLPKPDGPEYINWRRDNEDDWELYKSATLKNIKGTLRKLECHNLSYLYFVYA